MSLRILSLLVFSVIASSGYWAVWLYGKTVLASNVGYPYSLEIAFIFLTVLVILLGALLFGAVQIIIKPIIKLTKAVNDFSNNGTKVDVHTSWVMPREIKLLVKSFESFASHVIAMQKNSEENARMKTDFISTAAHQLRTPLTGIRWALEALLQEDLTPEQKELIASATEKSHDLVNTVGTLLDISSIESGKYKYTFANMDMQKFLVKEVADFQYMADERKNILQFIQSDKHFPDVRADEKRIKWVLDNLIENAIRYTPAGGIVKVSMGAIGTDKIAVYVSDTGIGIPASNRANIFERFYRSDNAIAKENKGNGLGLYIARTIAKDHGGDLNFSENTKGVGTVFTLSLPVAS